MNTQLVRNLDSVYIREGRLAVQRAELADANRDAVGLGGAAFCGILCGAGGVEAYLSEILAHQAEVRMIDASDRAKIQRERGVARKYLRLTKVWGKNLSIDPIYSHLNALISLRNAVVHRSAEFLEPGVWPTEAAPYQSVIPHAKGSGLDWTSQVLTVVTARWAVETAWEVLRRIDDYLPDPSRAPFRTP